MMQSGLLKESKRRFVIEQNRRLSDSVLWKLQREYFQRQGIDAWRQGTVPHYITSNPFIADAYARLVSGFLRDCSSNSCPLDPGQPVYIVELGAGSGRFAYHFLKKFRKLHNESALNDVPIKYIMTDFALRTIDYWQAHPWLQPLVENGQLDFAGFDAVDDTELKLIHSVELLAAGTVRNPLIVLANYFFDGIPQDAFYIKDERLYESLINITSHDNDIDPSDPNLLNHIETTFKNRPANGEYYDDVACNDILREYRQQLTDTFLLFPHTAMDCIRRLGSLSGGRLLLITADKGYSRKEALQNRGQPGISMHGSFSMMVNYHALGRYIGKKGGRVLHTNHHHNSLDVTAFLLGMSHDSIAETRQAYTTAIEQFGPDDFFTLKKGIEKSYDTLTVPQIMAYLRLSGWDANIFLGCFPTLLERADKLSGTEREELAAAIRQVWDTYYPIGEERDLPFNMGMLFYGMGYYTDALYCYRQSLELHGDNTSTFYNISMCYYCLENPDDALAYINKAIAMSHAFEAAKEMRNRIQAEIANETYTPIPALL